MKYLLLTKGKSAIVSDEDFEWLNQWKWNVNLDGTARRQINRRTKPQTIYLHRFIMNAPKDLQVDHINGNRLDNRRSNLRLCTGSLNCVNRESWKKSQTGYRGVRKAGKTYFAVIEKDGERITSKHFDTPEMAAQAYNMYAKELFGNFARLNEL